MKATLTVEENKRWEQLMAIGLNNGLADEQADKEAWEGLCEEFPRLRKYSGATEW